MMILAGKADILLCILAVDEGYRDDTSRRAEADIYHYVY